MKKYFLLLVLSVVLVCMLSACGCEHTWADATCLAPKTCTQCEKTEGEIGDHTWAEATCMAPKTCTVCSATEGDLADHVWEEATCISLKTCTVCSEREGRRGLHDIIPEYVYETNEKEKMVAGLCTVCEEKVEQQTDDIEAIALQILAGKWTAVELRNHGSGNNEDVREYDLVFEFQEDGSAVSAIPDCSGAATVSYERSNNSLMVFKMTVDGEVADIWLMPNAPDQITVWIPGYYSTFLCEKN